ncbi:TetR/AcrR family transcriptional regulator [Photobacterium rosenbergii]|uniref:TetR/AcrR family transcriptional regulator n=1 Tax=Photobacterium rosenbergii TaxID=294936 RepID=UPI001C994C02|nr:TetR/AcrR family transcriptional regulator [Photobacterium rosenbergii]MBY5948397.1 TetR/AcrR family transcriptional regulator [Photobacterium rosenbergii]
MATGSRNEGQIPKALEFDRILDAALEMAAEQDDWSNLSFVELAKYCGTSVNHIRHYYADTNAIANAWFSRALEAMLTADLEGIEVLPVKERLEYIIWRWFEALAPRHRVTSQMLGAKLHLPHVHHWVPMIFDLSRLVQFWRETAGLHAGGRRRQIEEVVLTGIFLATLRTWCRDESLQQSQAHARLLALLTRAERSVPFWFSTDPH